MTVGYPLFVFGRKSVRVSSLRVSAGRMQTQARGRLPTGVAEAGNSAEPDPEYIAEAATPTEDVWAREAALYRAKNGTRDDQRNP
jgi:hypothetical protein